VFAEVVHGAGGEATAVRRAWTGALAALERNGTGWLGAISGRAADGTFLAVLCFETQEMSRITADRLAEDSAWEPLDKAVGELVFRECPHVRAFAAGRGAEKVATVEVTQGMVTDARRVAAVFAKARGTDAAAGLLCWDDAGFACSLLYRSSARTRGKQAVPSECAADAAAASALRRDAAMLFAPRQDLDLGEPWSVLGLLRPGTGEGRPSDGEVER
jgi:hypothetical protein